MINFHDFLNKVLEIERENPDYSLGHYGENGLCDCIGLVIGAVRRCGGVWKGTHGTNYAVRNVMKNFRPFNQMDLKIGDLVYKSRDKNDPSWSLPSKYYQGNDQSDMNDYYHVGVVLSVYPLTIVHCTSPKIKRDDKQGQWKWAGELNYLDYENSSKEERVMSPNAVVIAANGYPVKYRVSPSTSADIVGKLNVGTRIEVVATSLEWSEIHVDNTDRTYFMMNKFIKPDPMETQQPGPSMADVTILVKGLGEKIDSVSEKLDVLINGLLITDDSVDNEGGHG